MNYDFEETSLTHWSRLDLAFLEVISGMLLTGRYVENALDTIGILDRRIAHEEARLSSEARGTESALQIPTTTISVR